MPNARTEWKCLQPEKLAIDPNATLAENENFLLFYENFLLFYIFKTFSYL